MKLKNRLLFPPLLGVALTSGIASAQTTWTKADNTTALTTSGSWSAVGVPAASGDSLLFDNTLTAYRAANIGTGLNVVGIQQTNSLNHEFEMTSSSSNTLSIGTGGVAITTSARLSFGAPVVLTGNQSWSMATGRINVKNTLTTGGNTLDVAGSGLFSGILSFTGNNTLGTEVTIGTMDRVYVQSGTVAFNGTNNTNTSFLMFGGTANVASMGNLTFASSIGKGSPYVQSGATLNYTGNTFSSDKSVSRDINGTSTITVATAGQTLGISGNLTTSTGTTTGGWALGGDGNLTLTGNITNAASTTVTKNGAGTVTLSGTNTYTGATTVTAGTLALVGGSQVSPITVNSGAALGFTLGSPTTSTSTVTFSGATPKVTVSGTPAAATLMTASGIIGIPVLDPAIPGYSLVVTATGLDLVSTAAQGTKADNSDAMDLSSSWVGGTKPTAGTYMIVDTTLTDHRTAALGDDLSVLGITASSTKNLTINNTATRTLTIGASGISSSGAGALQFNNATSLGGNITMASSGTGQLTFSPLTLTANQTWALGGTAANNRINVNNTLTTGGNTLGISAANASFGIINFNASNTLGSEVTIGTIGAMYVQGGGTTVSLNGTNNTNTSFSLFNGGTANIASMGNLTGASSIGKGSANVNAGTTLNYSGSTFASDKGFNHGGNAGDSTVNVTTAGQTLSMSGNLTNTAPASNGWKFGGAGNLTLSGVIQNSNGTTVTKQDAGTLTLSNAANAYTGATTVTAGTLALGANDVLPDLSDVSIGAATLDAASFDDTAGTLDVTAAATINLGAGANLVFANSSGNTWAGTLNITGTFVSGSSLNFGAGGLSAGQLLKISAAGFSSFALDGSGFLTATATAGYSSWASLNGAGPNLADDHDNDGVSNGVEYFIGGPAGPTTGFTPVPGITPGTLSVTWVKGPGYTGTYPANFVVETSTTLATGSWTTETLGGNVIISGNNVTYTFPAGPVKTFARLKVTGP